MPAELRERIIEASLKLFEQYGFHGVTVNQIVDAAGISKGGFYHHFTSKDELLFVIHDIFITYVLERASKANEQNLPAKERLRLIIKDFVSVFDIYKAHLTVFYQESIYLKTEHEEIVRKKRNEFKTIIQDVIEEGVITGDFRSDLSVEITTMAILGMVNWTYKWYQRNGEKRIEEIADIYTDLILHAVSENENIRMGEGTS
ncbi:TetR/AcrR family transcriptional regulator [Oceanobacillus alkalisoli]|uniref:TetR/AcrR family transcriptional regulator n=1 Tax=Oceanobacillus alkalisoli TaxID=2925113 RepID=UPI001F11F82A|nr:TetR family transcriptional regulator [Oceanobacillus alkalisoli]MCF3942330.1 TetR/AcrR family transcriptional regulator [Oceanobacillus alkalisoli]